MNKYVATLAVLVLAIAICETALLFPKFGKAPSTSTESSNSEVVKDDCPMGFLSRIGQGMSMEAKTVENKMMELFNPKEEKPDTPPVQPATKSDDKNNPGTRYQTQFAPRCGPDEYFRDGACRPIVEDD